MRTFTRPLPLLAVVVLVLNDHVMKGAGVLPTWLTGKLSDFVGLFFFPILLVGIAHAIRRPSRSLAGLVCGSTGLVFAAIKASPAACAFLSRHVATTTCDPTDLLALPAVALAYVYLIRIERAGAPAPAANGLERLGLVVAAVASLATSPYPRPFAAWKVVEESRAVGCARVDVWVSKSGKEGVGVSVAARGPIGCVVRVERASLVVGEATVATANSGAEVPIDRAVYVPLLFDNEKAWNDGQRVGTLELVLVAGDRPATVRFAMEHVWTRGTFGGPPPKPPLLLAVDPADAGALAADAEAPFDAGATEAP